MFIKIVDAAIPLSGAIIFWMLYTKRLPIKKNKDDNEIFYKNYKKFLLSGVIVLLIASVLILAG